MAPSVYPNVGLCHLFCPYLLILIFLLISFPPKTNSLHFNFTSFEQNKGIDLQGDASISSSQIQLTNNQRDKSLKGSSGRALYSTAMQLWDATTNRTTDFTTNFTFDMNIPEGTNNYGDGLTFLLVPENTLIPNHSGGGCLALFSHKPNHTTCLNQTTVAIEFDTFKNDFDPSSDHIGIDIKSIISVAYVNVSVGLKNKTSQAFISYDSTAKNLTVSLIVNETSPVSLSYIIDLHTVLPERVQVGFSASTGDSAELHKILNWSFNSTLEDTLTTNRTATTDLAATTDLTATTDQGRRSTNKGGLVAGVAVGLSLIVIIGVAIAWIKLRRKSPRADNIEDAQFDIDEEFDKEAGPKRFSYSELSQATNNFSADGKLGEGGFGGVYKGILIDSGSKEIAVKKIKSGSNQGKKEYISEVKIISRLRHRNLVQLLGWCHDHGELLLVYEFMPYKSLDFHLFGRELILLPWETRYKIALGLGSALLYLHEGWEQSVVHRDIKSSNVMLDLNFNPKLGDFGLARLVDHDVGLQTTVPAGTPGYLAPECLLTGKASKESDVYSFGIVALEIACGRKVIELKEHQSRVNLVEWVWHLYGKELLLEAIDKGLEGDFDEQQIKCLMVVGLWCSHPDVNHRPSIKQAIAALNFETPLPSLPPQLPVPIYVSPGMNMSHLYSFSSGMTEGSSGVISTSTTNSSAESVKSTSSTYPRFVAEIHSGRNSKSHAPENRLNDSTAK